MTYPRSNLAHWGRDKNGGQFPDIFHNDVIKWKHFRRYWPFVRIIHRSPVNSHHKGQWRGALRFSLICAWITGWENHRNSDLRPHRARYDVTMMKCIFLNENVCISITISLKFVPKGPINNIPALVQIMAWRRTGDKPLSEPMVVNLLTDTYMSHSVSMI